jgi:hypothetical protein
LYAAYDLVYDLDFEMSGGIPSSFSRKRSKEDRDGVVEDAIDIREILINHYHFMVVDTIRVGLGYNTTNLPK